MPNAYIPRAQVHEWSESIGNDPNANQASLQRLLKEQRRLTRFVEENAEHLDPVSGGITVYLMGVIIRLFDLAGGRLKSATWAQVREAASKVQGAAGSLLPLDDGFAERVRAVEWRAQPHVLDEALMALFEREATDEEEELSKEEALKVFSLLWVATEVLDGNWKPAKGWSGETEYSYVHIEPTPAPSEDEAAAE